MFFEINLFFEINIKAVTSEGFHHSKMINGNTYSFLSIVSYDNLHYIKGFSNGKST